MGSYALAPRVCRVCLWCRGVCSPNPSRGLCACVAAFGGAALGPVP